MALFQSPLCSSALGTTEATQPGSGSDQLNRRIQEMVANQQHRHQQQHQQYQLDGDGRQSSTCTQVVWIFFWLFVLILLAYPLALTAAFLYVFLSPLSMIKCCQPTMKFLLDLLELPLSCVRNLVVARQVVVM